jgi:hypothetical protein
VGFIVTMQAVGLTIALVGWRAPMAEPSGDEGMDEPQRG